MYLQMLRLCYTNTVIKLTVKWRISYAKVNESTT